jgi:L-2-hydroxyglutarate oxidase
LVQCCSGAAVSGASCKGCGFSRVALVCFEVRGLGMMSGASGRLSVKRFDFVVVGAGIVGLSAAYKLLLKKPDARVAVVEKEDRVAAHQTSHNSGVIHSGLYYKPGSYKAKLCLQGYAELLEFAKQHDVPFKICGKLVVANGEAEEARLVGLRDRGEANGLGALRVLSSEEAQEREPFVRCTRALWVPQTGVIDYKVVSQKLQQLLVDLGAEFFFGERVVSLVNKNNGLSALTTGRSVPTRQLINCAGLYSDKVAQMDQGLRRSRGVGSVDDLIAGEREVQILPFRGEYYDLAPKACEKVKGLIYPVPDPAFPFLGVHLTRGVDNHVEAGPNAVLALRREGYSWGDIHIDELLETLTWPGFRRIAAKHWPEGLAEVWRSASKASFLESLQELVPSLQADDLLPRGSGVRAQASHKNGELLDDFYFEQTERCLHVVNAPSPAATSGLAIGGRLWGGFWVMVV